MRFQLSTLKKASLTITDYFTTVKQLSDTLFAISHPLGSSEITLYLLAGLPPSMTLLSPLLPPDLNLSHLMTYMVASSLMKITSTNKTPPVNSAYLQLTLSPPIPLGVTIVRLYIEVALTMAIV
jgi:Zn-dependent protease with chaperone function